MGGLRLALNASVRLLLASAIVVGLSAPGVTQSRNDKSSSSECQYEDAKLNRAAIKALIAVEHVVALQQKQNAVCAAIDYLIAAELKLLEHRTANQIKCVIDLAYIESSESNLKRAKEYVQSLGGGCVN